MKDGYYTFKFYTYDMIGLIRDNVVIFAIPRKLETNFKIKDKVFIMKKL